MSAIAESARVSVLIADFANTDNTGKINVIGAGISFISVPAGAPTPPISVVVACDVPESFAGDSYILSAELWDADRDRVKELPTDESGTLQAVRLSSAVNVERPQTAFGFTRPTSGVLARHLMLLNFPNGLALSPGMYEWRAQVDGHHDAEWSARLHVLAPAPPPVFGGPANPSSIPGFDQPPAADNDQGPEA